MELFGVTLKRRAETHLVEGLDLSATHCEKALERATAWANSDDSIGREDDVLTIVGEAECTARSIALRTSIEEHFTVEDADTPLVENSELSAKAERLRAVAADLRAHYASAPPEASV